MSMPSAKLNLPHVQGIVLRRFSLFQLEPEIAIDFKDGVFCLAGANGLGKSTFLTSVNYAITGIVPDPQRKFESVNEFYSHNLKFASEYFSGRISETDREAAEVAIKLIIGHYRLELTRGIFEPKQLRELSIYKLEAGVANPILNTTNMGREERHEAYMTHVAKFVGLSSFEQLAFLQHFVFTFDERRHLLFWDQVVLDQVLFLAFGVNPVEANTADSLRREAEKAASLARNANWQASETRKRLIELEKAANIASKEQDVPEDVVEEHQKLLGARENSLAEVERLGNELKDVNLRLADLSAQQAMLRAEYATEFEGRIRKHSHVAQHPLIITSVNENKCGLCGSQSEQVSRTIKSRSEADSCPLCNSSLTKTSDDLQSMERLKNIDGLMSDCKIKLDDAIKGFQRVKNELRVAVQEEHIIANRLSNYERQNQEIISLQHARSHAGNDLELLLKSYRDQMALSQREKETQYIRRDEKLDERRKLQHKIERAFFDAQSEFIPLFKQLAILFLGLDLSIRMESRPSTGINLALEVQSAARRHNHQLSESQRFFVDIALRMALAQYMSGPEGKACLYIDTPEGSLDIAYESRAGDMFSTFVHNGYSIIMTANINSSQLLRRLAEKCGRAKLELCQMIYWAQLSDVQLAEHKLFEQAYSQLEVLLDNAK